MYDHYKKVAGVSVVHLSAVLFKDDTGKTSLDKAVENLIDKGIPVVVPADNYSIDVSGTKIGKKTYCISPARNTKALVVGAVNASSSRWVNSALQPLDWNSGSGYGSRVDVFAPGVGVETAARDGAAIYRSYVGTSIAAPFATGAVAGYLQTHPTASPKAITAWLRAAAAPSLNTTGLGAGSANRFLYLAPGGF